MAVQVVGVQGCDGEAPLALPSLSLDREDTGKPHLLKHRLDLPPAPEALRALSQDRVDLLRVTDRNYPPRTDAKLEDRPLALTPHLGHRVTVVQADPVGIADQRKP